jgi:hypothetical protein
LGGATPSNDLPTFKVEGSLIDIVKKGFVSKWRGDAHCLTMHDRRWRTRAELRGLKMPDRIL